MGCLQSVPNNPHEHDTSKPVSIDDLHVTLEGAENKSKPSLGKRKKVRSAPPPPPPPLMGEENVVEGKFTDPNFPPDSSSLGDKLQGKDWRRASDMGAMALYQSGGGGNGYESGDESGHDDFAIDPSDIKQGALGDCWLLSSISCLAEFPGDIENLFVTKETDEAGRYVLQLFCTATKQWVNVEIDDHIPVSPGRNSPCCAKSVDNEMWVMLLEKAFAKCWGSYGNLSGGFNWFAFQVSFQIMADGTLEHSV
jgi:hypothetical protein